MPRGGGGGGDHARVCVRVQLVSKFLLPYDDRTLEIRAQYEKRYTSFSNPQWVCAPSARC